MTPPRLGIPPGQWLSRNLIKTPVHYALCLNEKHFNEELARLRVKPCEWPPFLGSATANATTHHLEYKGRPVAIVCLQMDAKRTQWEVLGLLVHEAVHIWQLMCRSMGETEPSAEFEAYSIQWISQELMWAWNNGRGRPRRGHHGG